MNGLCKSNVTDVLNCRNDSENLQNEYDASPLRKALSGILIGVVIATKTAIA